ncbi:hypothetical protein N7495_005949 [Penicillium taxi]|uniref:uncharacterized protein n=1 Tax=Penicillium taxi TaxID=168475 RepID=UPI002545025E|nr:uncharacterized protein N7495_005949 [Penicillium taxi]KAJ5894258.1 hypothetical protein N7495_005949 [Penicillium taxi]
MVGSSIRPDDLESFNVMGRQTGTRRDLSGREFLTHCPPDIPPRHRILALLAITDAGDMASPSQESDGWIVSDFYLFHYLLSPVFPTIRRNQLWMTCEDPSRLVDKYTEYVHGDPKGERRVVLDAGMLPNIDAAQNIRVVSRENLLERYLSTLREQVIEAAVNEEHLILLIFGHGTEEYGVPTGGSVIEKEPILQMKDVHNLLYHSSPVTLFITSCYSGGWLVKPNINGRFMNATSVAAASDLVESSSWSASGSVGRVGGSLAASAMLRCLIDTEETLREASSDPTYIQFASSIHDSVKGMGLLEDDDWESSYKKRLGLPLASYQTKWLELRAILPFPSEEDEVSTAMSAGRSTQRARILAHEYLTSFPGFDELSPNMTVHYGLRNILKGVEISNHKLDNLTQTVVYRLGSMHEADYFRELAGADFPSIFKIDIPWGLILNQDPNPLYGQTWSLLLELEISTPLIGIRFTYPKSNQYLAVALVKSLKTWDLIEPKVRYLATMKKSWYKFIYKAWLGNRVSSDLGVISSRCAFLEALNITFDSERNPHFNTEH